MRAATNAYREEMDTLKEFLNDATSEEVDGYATSRDLHRSFEQWSREHCEKSVGRKIFSQMLIERGYQSVRLGKTRNRGFAGLRLLAGWPRLEESE